MFGNPRDPNAPAHIRAHLHSSEHRDALLRSAICGCFYCLAVFPSSEIVEWIDDDQTGLCPKCGIDSVIGSDSGYAIDPAFLREMHVFWFSAC